ncbi:MAG: hypothetical protein ABI461_17660 [Polyangiaceae bacterium]
MNRALFALIIPVFAVVACGGSVFGSGDDGSGGGGGSDGGASDGDGGSKGSDGGRTSSGCPSAIPAAGGACTPSGIQCEYGTNNGQCGSPYMDCVGGTWTPPPLTPGAACLPHDSCPATKADVAIGAACGDEDQECNFPDGRCTCAYGEGLVQVYPDGGQPPREWRCEQPTEGCPVNRPRIGSACSQENQTCTYGDCSMPDSVDIQCNSGAWESMPFACAG